VRPILRKCIGHSNLNGLLHIGQMHLLSAKQCRTLLAGIQTPITTPAPSHVNDDDLPDLIDDKNPSTSTSSSTTTTTTANSESKREATATATRGLRLLDVGAGDGRVTSKTISYSTDTPSSASVSLSSFIMVIQL
jgi:hypothetical protein